MINKVFNEDCLIGMKRIADNSVDMILCDLPYGTTACKWDTIIPFEPLWEHYKRIIKDNGAIVLTSSQPFTSALIMSNAKMFKHSWIWDKGLSGNIMLANYQPMKIHEDILVFSYGKCKYYPIKVQGKPRQMRNNGMNDSAFGSYKEYKGEIDDMRNPKTILYFPNTDRKSITHPTEKPVKLFEYLIKTYTNENEIVLDNCMGSGTTAIACLNTNRKYIGFEIDKGYYDIIMKRIEDKQKESQERLF